LLLEASALLCGVHATIIDSLFPTPGTYEAGNSKTGHVRREGGASSRRSLFTCVQTSHKDCDMTCYVCANHTLGLRHEMPPMAQSALVSNAMCASVLSLCMHAFELVIVCMAHLTMPSINMSLLVIFDGHILCDSLLPDNLFPFGRDP